MQTLQETIKNVYLPLEEKNHDMKTTFQKFISQIEHSTQQVSGTVNIKLPEKIEDIDDQTALNDKVLIDKFVVLMEDWTKTIRNILQEQLKKKTDPNSAYAEIEFWRNKSATLSTLHQQLQNPFVATVKRVRKNLFFI